MCWVLGRCDTGRVSAKLLIHTPRQVRGESPMDLFDMCHSTTMVIASLRVRIGTGLARMITWEPNQCEYHLQNSTIVSTAHGDGLLFIEPREGPHRR